MEKLRFQPFCARQGVDIVSYDGLNQRMVITTNLYANGVHIPVTTVHNDYANVGPQYLRK